MSKKNRAPLAELRDWSMPWVEFNVHKLIRHQVRLAADGVESSVITGPKGTGKTSSVRRALRQFAKEEAGRCDRGGTATPIRRSKYYIAGTADGRKTALRDLLAELGRHVSPGQGRHWSVRDYLEAAVADLKGPAGNRNIRVVCIDEADRINAANLDDLRKILDVAERDGYPLGMILIGNDTVATSLARNAELGQRFSAAINVRRFDRDEVRPLLAGLHPGLGILSHQAGWEDLVEEILDAAQGSMRRLERILENATVFALSKDGPFDEAAIEFALKKLAQ